VPAPGRVVVESVIARLGARADAPMPRFDLVTGISSGSLQAPYALLGRRRHRPRGDGRRDARAARAGPCRGRSLVVGTTDLDLGAWRPGYAAARAAGSGR
jgi:hypothetical protein